ncbi:MAG TPA: hypothetical protein VHO24_09740 [Opitutaceae bacterium]|nr:hypothetical protein [Opitutaceae bacterium]
MNNPRYLPAIIAVAVAVASSGLALLGGCSRRVEHAPSTHTEHVHAAKHGGVAVELGEHEFQVEFTHGDTQGTLFAYVMDGHMNEYVRIEAPRFSATATIDGVASPIVFEATAEPATGEKVGDSSLFTAKLAGASARSAVDLSVPALVIKGHIYQNVAARVPARTKS